MTCADQAETTRERRSRDEDLTPAEMLLQLDGLYADALPEERASVLEELEVLVTGMSERLQRWSASVPGASPSLRGRVLVLPEGIPSEDVQVLGLVAAERVRQIREFGYTPKHDDAHEEIDLARAGGAYLVAPTGGEEAAVLWPWPREVMRRVGAAVFDADPIGCTTSYLVRKPRGEQMVVGLALGVAAAGRRRRAGRE